MATVRRTRLRQPLLLEPLVLLQFEASADSLTDALFDMIDKDHDDRISAQDGAVLSG